MALAFNKTMERVTSRKKSLRDFTYTDKEIADDIYAAMNSTQFLGVSVRDLKSIIIILIKLISNFYFKGVVAFSSQGDRIALTQIEQMINGKYEKLGYYDTQLDNLTWLNTEQWIGGKVNKIGFSRVTLLEVLI